MAITKRNKIIIGAVLLCAIVALVVVLTNNKKSTLAEDFYLEDPSTVSKIFIVDKLDNTILAEKQEDDSWLINEKYDANMPIVNMVLETLHKMRIRYPVSKSALNNVIKSLSTSATKVEVYQEVYTINLFDKIKLFPKEKLTKVWYIGHETRDNQGSYVLLKGQDEPYVAYIPGFRGFLEPRFNTSETTWRSRKVFDADVHALQSIKVEIPERQEESYEITKTGNDINFKLLSTGETLSSFDTAHMAQFLSSFVNVNFDEFVSAVPEIQMDSVFTKNPGFIVTVTDTAQHARTIKTYIKLDVDFDPEDEDAFALMYDVDRMYAVVDNADTVFIQYYVFDNILFPASYFMK